MQNIIQLDLEGAAEGAAEGLTGLASAAKAAGRAVTGALTAPQKALSSLEDKLLVMRLTFGRLKAAVYRAFAPIANLVVPVLNDAMFALIRFFNKAAKVMGALFGFVVEESEEVTSATGTAVKRALADFDTLDRLEHSGSGGSYTVTTPGTVPVLSSELQAIAHRLRALLEPLEAIDLTAARDAFRELWEAVCLLGREAFSGLEWAWHNLLVPIARWGTEQALPAFLGVLTEALKVLHALIQEAKPLFSWLWENFLQPLGAWTGETVAAGLTSLRQNLEALGAWLRGDRSAVEAFSQSALGLFGSLKLVQGVASLVNLALSGIGSLAASAVGSFSDFRQSLSDAAVGLGGFFAGFARHTDVFSQFTQGFRSMCNSVIGFVNGIISAMQSGINAVISGINSLSVTIPDWVPGVGGKKLGFSLKAVTLPQVPYLAKGAVLPPNKPFLAMVGDQRRGTNIEAPLETIQEAVASVLLESMAGQDRGNALLAQILEAVCSIQIGDETIAAAARRHQDRRSRITGGI